MFHTDTVSFFIEVFQTTTVAAFGK